MTWKLGVVIMAVAGAFTGCKAKAGGLAKIGTPVVLNDVSWTVVEALDLGQVLPPTSDGSVVRTPGHFVEVHYRLVNTGSSDVEVKAPDLIDYDSDTGKSSLHFRSRDDAGAHLPTGDKTLGRSKVPPKVPGDYWTIYDVAANVTDLHVWFSEDAAQLDLGALKPSPVTPPVAPAPPPTPTAADTIRAHPDLISIVPYEWQTRISATITGRSADSCPALKAATWKDEFERREKQDSAMASCSSDNQKALAFAKTCPVSVTFAVRLTDYDFDAKRFRIESPRSAETVLVTNGGRVYVPDGPWLLTWPGSHARSRGEGLPNGGCIGALNDARPQLAGFTLDLPMSEDDARDLRTRVDGIKGHDKALEVAFLVAGTAAADDLVCDAKTARAAEGTALAWRLLASPDVGGYVPLTDWNAVGSWEPAASCDDEKSFYGLEAGSLGKVAKIVKTQCPAGTTAGRADAPACGCYRDTTPVGVAPRPSGDCEQEPKASGRDCLWRCR